jgi:N-acetylmuramic acid 6-phosphate etherase
VALVAGGPAARDTAEDDLAGAADDLARVGLRGEDALVAVAASGTTPYTLALAEAARAVGSAVVAVVAVGGSPLQAFADVAVVADVGPEVLRGSTRLGAGTAQKLVLDALTTAVMVRLGHVHGDLMIDVVAANEKLRERASAVVAEIAGCPPEAARTALDACGGDARAAAVHLLTGRPPAEAMEHARSRRTLRAALES